LDVISTHQKSLQSWCLTGQMLMATVSTGQRTPDVYFQPNQIEHSISNALLVYSAFASPG
jgi:hypothetical protein